MNLRSVFTLLWCAAPIVLLTFGIIFGVDAGKNPKDGFAVRYLLWFLVPAMIYAAWAVNKTLRH